MNTLFRVLIILVVASIVGGLMYVAVDASGSSSFEEGRPGGGGQFRPDGDGDGDAFRPEGEGRGERGGFGFPGGIIKALVLMSLAGGIYSAIAWAVKKSKRSATA